MVKNVLVFLPNSLDTKRSGYIKGLHKCFADCEAFYITSNQVYSHYCLKSIGFIGKKTKLQKNVGALLHLGNKCDYISIENKVVSSNCSILLFYDYEGFKNSNITNSKTNYGRHFEILSDILKKEQNNVQNGKKIIFKSVALGIFYLLGIISWLLSKIEIFSCSATYQHLRESVTSFQTSVQDFHDNGMNPHLCNKFSAKVIDMILGILALNYFLKYESNIIETVQVIIEEIISNLQDLLLYLMGSPIGLKLNYAFNISLGQFFFYHMSLWKIFLFSLKPIFTVYFKYLVLPGALGLSFQIAMISDTISVATFHVYCIYVYAARLFNIQLKGLIALWRLFIGKKYNPLRERIDSCQYSPNQLFIGTLGFTVLLFLLPTTVMYYTVFSMFRLVILAIDGILLRSVYFLKAIPLYMCFLWLKRSPSLAGSLFMVWRDCHENSIAKLDVKLNILPLTYCIKSSMPDTIHMPKSLGSIFHCVITGTLL